MPCKTIFLHLALALNLISCQTNRQPESVSIDRLGEIVEVDQAPTPTIHYGSGDVVSKCYLDRAGNMWFITTNEGVFKYDGDSFTNFTVEDGLCGNEVWAVIQDRDGLMWFGTINGLCSFDGQVFEHIPIPEDETESEWLTDGYPIVNPNGVLSILQDRNGGFWIGSNGAGAYHYDGHTFTSYLKNRGALMPDSLHHNVILSIVEDQSGNIWFSSFSHGGVSRYDGLNFTHYDTEDGLGDDMVASSYLGRSGRLWFGTRSGGMSYFDGDEFVTIHEPDGPCQNNMATLLEDQHGKLWVANYARGGVCRYEGESFIPFDAAGSDQLVDIKCMAEDEAGNIWLGGRFGLLWRYDGQELKDFTQLKRR